MDVPKYICEWHRTSPVSSSNIALNHSDVNLNNVKLKVKGPVTWKPLSDNTPGGGASHELTVPGPGQANWIVSITEEIKGLNKEITLDLDGTGHKDSLGDDVEIDPSKKHSKKSIKIKSSVASTQTSCYKDYKAQFECTVSMGGVVLMGRGLQHDLSEIFKDLRESRKPSDTDLQHVKFEGKEVLIPLKGTVHFHWQA